jgi:hypothetical protein
MSKIGIAGSFDKHIYVLCGRKPLLLRANYFPFLSVTYQNIALSKYRAIRQRSFKTRMELFLFESLLRSRIENSLNDSEFLAFRPSDELVAKLELAWQSDEIEFGGNKLFTKDIDAAILDWLGRNESTSKNLFGAYQSHFEEFVLSFDQFKDVFPEDPKRRICHYTHLSDYDFEILRRQGGIKTKNARGRYMEIDRLNSNREYYRDNIVLCCYWANNAKTDEFTYPEFLSYVGPAMEVVFKKRLDNK